MRELTRQMSTEGMANIEIKRVHKEEMRESRTGHIKILNENIKNNLNKETEIRRITQEAALQVEVVMQLITTLHLEVVIMRNTALHLKVVTQDPDDIAMIIIGIHAIVKLIIALRLEVVCHTALRLEAVVTDCGDVSMYMIVIVVIHRVVATPDLEDNSLINGIGVLHMEVTPVMMPMIRLMMTVDLNQEDTCDNMVGIAGNWTSRLTMWISPERRCHTELPLTVRRSTSWKGFKSS